MKTTDNQSNSGRDSAEVAVTDQVQDDAHTLLDPLFSHRKEHLNWDEIHELWPELATDPFERYETLLDLYLDERCSPQVAQELSRLEDAYPECKRLRDMVSMINASLVTGMEAAESEITVSDAEESLQALLKHRWDELELGDLGLDELREHVLESQIFSQQLVKSFEEMEPAATLEDAEESLTHILERRWDELELGDLGLDELREYALESQIFSQQLVKSFEEMDPTATLEDAEESLTHVLERRWDELEMRDLGLDELREHVIESQIFSQQLVKSFEEMEPAATLEDAEESLTHVLEHRWDELELRDLGLDELREHVIESQIFSQQLVKSFEEMEPASTLEDAEESLTHVLEYRWDELELNDLGLDGLREHVLESQIFSQQLVKSLDEIEPAATLEDAEESLRHLLEHRWDDLELAHLDLDDLRDELLTPQRSSGSMRVEYEPVKRLQRSKRRLISGVCTVAAAAILFAYGPNLIESDVAEREAPFPLLSQEQRPSASNVHAPLASQEGKALTVSPKLILDQIDVGQLGDQASAHMTYHLSLANLGRDTQIQVDLWRKRLNSKQQVGWRAQLKRASNLGEVHVHSDSGSPIHVRSYQLPNSELSIAEYLVGDQHYQWSGQLNDMEREALMAVVKLHLQELR